MRDNERPRLAARLEEGRAVLSAHGVAEAVAPIVLCPGAEYGPAKRWPVGHFGALAARLIAGGETVVVVGSAKDSGIAAEIRAVPGAEGVVDLAGRTTLGQAVDVMALAKAVVTNDSGSMHIAAALDRPTVALFGSSSPARTPPLSDAARVVSIDLDCRPCFARVCPLGHTNCLVQLSVDQVFDALAAVSAQAVQR